MPLPDPPDALKNATKRRNTRRSDPAYERSFSWLAYTLPTAGDDSEALKVTDEIVQTLNKKSKFPRLKIDRVSKGGSLGRRTLVAGDYDVDLQIFINQPMTYPNNWTRGRLLEELGMIRDILESDSVQAIVVEEGTQYDDVLQVEVGGVDADVLLVPNMVPKPDQTTNRVAEQREALLGPLMRNPRQAEADGTREAALAESLTEFVTRQQDSAKAVVRLMKAWYKYAIKKRDPAAIKMDARGRGPPKVPSVALELLVLAADEKNECKMLSRFIRALELLVKAVDGGEVVAVQAGDLGYPRGEQCQFEHVWREHPVKIIHPIDPTCNVARPRKAGSPDWRGLADAARELLSVINNGTLQQLVCESTLAKALEQLAEIKGERLPWIEEDNREPAAGRRHVQDRDDLEEARRQIQQLQIQDEQPQRRRCSIC